MYCIPRRFSREVEQREMDIEFIENQCTLKDISKQIQPPSETKIGKNKNINGKISTSIGSHSRTTLSVNYLQ